MSKLLFKLALKLLPFKGVKGWANKKINPKYDPFFEIREEYDDEGQVVARHKGKRKKDKRSEKPEYISQEDYKLLGECRDSAYFWDTWFSYCGIPVGWSAIIGLIPFVGDAVEVLFSMRIVRKASKTGLPHKYRARMVSNVVWDFLYGLVPVLGDVVDALYKANGKNVAILEDWLVKKAIKEGRLRPGDDPRMRSARGDLESGRMNTFQPSLTDSPPRPNRPMVATHKSAPSAPQQPPRAVVRGEPARQNGSPPRGGRHGSPAGSAASARNGRR